jgi:hypothetical protein
VLTGSLVGGTLSGASRLLLIVSSLHEAIEMHLCVKPQFMSPATSSPFCDGGLVEGLLGSLMGRHGRPGVLKEATEGKKFACTGKKARSGSWREILWRDLTHRSNWGDIRVKLQVSNKQSMLVPLSRD